MYYWIEKTPNRNTCPYDHHSLHDVIFTGKSFVALAAQECPFCEGIFLPYVDVDAALRHPDISISFLSPAEQKKIQVIRRKAAIDKASEIKATERAKENALRRKREEEEKLRREKERQRREAQLALRAKKEKFKHDIRESFRTNYLFAEDLFKINNTENLLTLNDFYSLREEFVSAWFRENSSESAIIPDKEQTAAIASTHKNIQVVARAGSGKSSTIVNRFRFLTEHCCINPSAILLLAFNRKAAIELREKIKEQLSTHEEREESMPHIMTFHAIAHSIVRPEEAIIYDDEEAGTMELSRTVQSIIDEVLQDATYATKIKRIMLAHFKGNWESIEAGGHNLAKEEQLAYLRSLPKQTLKGEYVKSYGEKVIANTLFEHDIDYRYEQSFRWTDGSIYRPDFTITLPSKKHIIVEYFGLAGNPEYDKQIENKRDFWNRKKVSLIEVYPADVSGGAEEFSSELLAYLKEDGVPYRKLDENELWERIKDRSIDEFTKAIKSFVGRCRKKELSSDELKKLILFYQNAEYTENLFLEIASYIYNEYLIRIKKDHKEDFDGLMTQARLSVHAGITSFDKRDSRGDLKELKYIMIDEYQDFSHLFDHFLETIRFTCPSASIFCVGDDWQAINAFAGSDVQYFHQFTQRYEDSCRYFLKTNYRSKKEIVDISTGLMSRGDIVDGIKTIRQGKGIVRVGYFSDFIPSLSEQKIHEFDCMTPAILRLVSRVLADDKNVVFLARTNDRLPVRVKRHIDTKGSSLECFLASIHSFFPPELRKRITASTTHKYKGKEEDAVIILDAMAGFYPLIHPAWIFQRVFGDDLERLCEEELRLFYVALSRAKNDLYVMTSKGEESPFLSKLGYIKRINWNDYAPLLTAKNEINVVLQNQVKYATIPIKDKLKQAGFEWNGKVWHRNYSRDSFDLTSIFNQSWAHEANHVFLIIYNEYDQIEDAYLFNNGEIIHQKLS